MWSHLICDQDRTERVVAVAIAIGVVETEHASTRTIIVTASATEERRARDRKVRVIAVPRCCSVTACARLIHRVSIHSFVLLIVIFIAI